MALLGDDETIGLSQEARGRLVAAVVVDEDANFGCGCLHGAAGVDPMLTLVDGVAEVVVPTYEETRVKERKGVVLLLKFHMGGSG